MKMNRLHALLTTLSMTYSLFALAATSHPKQFPIAHLTEELDWNFRPEILSFQNQIPKKVAEYFSALTKKELLQGKSAGFTQKVAASATSEARKTAVEFSQILIPTSYSHFLEVFRPAQWGTRLDHYLGGQTQVLDRDSLDRPVLQIERMVLSALPRDLDFRATNQDMTKLEEVVYESDRATIYWKVIFSDNGSTEMDLGSVEFRAFDESSVLVTFHSAHRLRMFGVKIPPALAKRSLRSVFLDHLRRYQKQLMDKPQEHSHSHP